MARVRTYDASKVQVIIGGAPISGFADDSMVKVERGSDMFTKTVGCDGEVTRNKSSDRSGTVTISLKGSSASNDVLNAFAVADEINNDGVVPVLVADLSGRTVATAPEGWVRKLPSLDLGKESKVNEWVIDCASLSMIVGGN